VAPILANPRHTGRQVWNRQRTDHDRPDDASRSGRGKVMRWNSTDEWVISKQVAHPALVSEADFGSAAVSDSHGCCADETAVTAGASLSG
jgi:hypothetical protein